MSKKVLILSGSPRRGGNSDLLCDEFSRGAQASGHRTCGALRQIPPAFQQRG